MFRLVLTICAALFIQSCVKQQDTCYDNKQNNGEEGIDCGGPCKYSCSGVVTPPPTTSNYTNAPCAYAFAINSIIRISPASTQLITTLGTSVSGVNYSYQRYNSSGSRVEVTFYGPAGNSDNTFIATGTSAYPPNSSYMRVRVRWNNSPSIYPSGTLYYKVYGTGKYVSFCGLGGYSALIRIN